MSEYESLQNMFNEPKYAPTKFVCRACETTVFWGELRCKVCDKMLEWCPVRKEVFSFVVKI